MTIQTLLMFVELVVVLIVTSPVRSSHDLKGYLHLFNFGPQLAQCFLTLFQVNLKTITLSYGSATIIDQSIKIDSLDRILNREDTRADLQ